MDAASLRVNETAPQWHKLEGLPWQGGWLDRLPISTVLWTLIGLGIFSRLLRYLLCFPLWPDEGFLAANYLERGYFDLVGSPLEYHQVAPPFYLWAQLAVVQVLGFNEYTLRLIPLLLGIGGLFLFWRVAARLLGGTALVLAVGIFAVGYPTIRYAVEAKPYGSDVFTALVLLNLAVTCWQEPNRRWVRWLLVACVPLALGWSYPAVFLCGGISLAWAWVLWQRLNLRESLAWVAFNGVLVASFLGVYLLAGQSQSSSEQYMKECWAQAFPPTESIGSFFTWLVWTHTGDMLPYPVGSANGGSTLTFLWIVTALTMLAVHRQGAFVLAAVVPLGLNFLAALLERYPYGGHVRLMLYMAPLFCLLAGLGAAYLTRWFFRVGPYQRACLAGFLLLFAAIPTMSVVRDFIRPYKHTEYLANRNFAQWFWTNHELDSEVVCLKTDLGLDFAPGTFEWGDGALYECNMRIYSPRHAAGEEPSWDTISDTRPLRCVLFRVPEMPFDNERFQAWLDQMSQKYELTDWSRHPFGRFAGHDDLLATYGVEVFEFVPRDTATPPTGPAEPIPTARPWERLIR